MIDQQLDHRVVALDRLVQRAVRPGRHPVRIYAPLEAWVENGVEPNSTVAKNRAGNFERPVCAWPKLPYYQSGDPARASSFVCR